MKIIISNNPTSLEAELAKYASTATVEAEFGQTAVVGNVLTLAHHEERAGRPCPCGLPNFPDLGIEAVGISHVDLDTLGGVMAVMGQKPDRHDWVREFWAAAALVDVNGVHKLRPEWYGPTAPDMVRDSLNAWWAFSESEAGRVYPPQDGSAVEVDLSEHFKVLQTLLAPEIDRCLDGIDEWEHEVYCGCSHWGTNLETWESPEREALIEAGRTWAAGKAALEESSYVGQAGCVVVRSATDFTNHLYNHDGEDFLAVVGFNEARRSITISLADPVEGVHCGEFCRSLWGPEAGGHAGIGGSPHHVLYGIDDAIEAAEKLAAILFVS